MAPPRYLPSISTLEHWVTPVEEGGLGLTHQEIADRVYAETGVQVSRASVSSALSKAGLTRRIRYDDVIPWRVKTIHSRHHLVNMLRLEGRQRRGGALTSDEERNLATFKRTMQEKHAVVAYLPDTEEGWWIVKARPQDKGLIREP